jgi:hypothetical protein
VEQLTGNHIAIGKLLDAMLELTKEALQTCCIQRIVTMTRLQGLT